MSDRRAEPYATIGTVLAIVSEDQVGPLVPDQLFIEGIGVVVPVAPTDLVVIDLRILDPIVPERAQVSVRDRLLHTDLIDHVVVTEYEHVTVVHSVWCGGEA